MEVTLYSKPACQQCKATVRKLDKLKIEYSTTDMSVDEEALALVVEHGFAEAPVVMVRSNGELVDSWSGFRPDKLESLLN